jgi:hypothetical protein
MDTPEVWTDWIMHDGLSCPVIGEYVLVECADGHQAEGIVYPLAARAPCALWIWSTICPRHWMLRVTRYRVRRNGQALMLIERIKALPALSGVMA